MFCSIQCTLVRRLAHYLATPADADVLRSPGVAVVPHLDWPIAAEPANYLVVPDHTTSKDRKIRRQ